MGEADEAKPELLLGNLDEVLAGQRSISRKDGGMEIVNRFLRHYNEFLCNIKFPLGSGQMVKPNANMGQVLS